jgi:mitogen-activated protein kinase 1/3
MSTPKWNIGPRFELIKKVGKGTYGSVFEAKDTLTNEKVAVKNLKSIFEDEIEAKHMLREICIMRTLDHANIIKIKDIIIPPNSENYNNVYIVMEHAEADLKKLCKSPTYLDHSQVRFLMYQAICGCRYMHSANIMHRDIKPANILINSNCSLKICDFGLSRSYRRLNQNFNEGAENSKREQTGTGADRDNTQKKSLSRCLTGHVVTRWYRAPEVILMEKEYGKEMDIWSLGCLFAEMLGMIRENLPHYIDRTPLFPGKSCFPLSPDLNTNGIKAGYPCSEFDQLSLIFQIIGTDQDLSFITDSKAKKYVEAFPKTPAKDLRELYPAITANELDLLKKMISFNPCTRITLDEALNHPYFFPVRDENYEMLATAPADFIFDGEHQVDLPTLREIFKREISRYRS